MQGMATGATLYSVAHSAPQTNKYCQ